MAKKTSRAARVQQNSRLQEIKRETSARPLVPTNTIGSMPTNGRTAVAAEPFKVSISANDLADKPAVNSTDVVENSTAVAPTNPTPAVTRTPVSSAAATRPSATALPPRRFLNAQPRQTQEISREEEYRFISADLLTVLVLAILMVVALVVLTLIIGR